MDFKIHGFSHKQWHVRIGLQIAWSNCSSVWADCSKMNSCTIIITTMWNKNWTSLNMLFGTKGSCYGLYHLLDFCYKLQFYENSKRSHFPKFKILNFLCIENCDDIQLDNISSDLIWYSDRLGELFIQRLILSVSEPPKISTGGDSGVTLMMVLPN